ncbi:MAG: hypothetical protein ABII27_05350 [bacterium]
MKKTDLSLGVSYFGNYYKSHAKKDLSEISGCCNYVVLPFSESDLIFHKGAFGEIVKEARRMGLTVWVDPWALGGVFGGEAFSKFLLEHRRAWQFLSNGRSVPCACFNNPDFRLYMKDWIRTISTLGGQVIFWDEPHYYMDINLELKGIYACTCWVCREKYKKEFDCDMPDRLDARSRDFRLNTIGSFLEDMMSFAKKQGLKNALTIYAIRGIAQYDLIWERAASLSNVDIFGCDPYWRWHFKHNPRKFVWDFSKRVVDSCNNYKKEPHIWIQAMKLPKGKEYEIEDAAIAAYDAGVRNMAAWSYDGGELIDGLYSPRYDLVWKTVSKAFKKLRKL